ncbi:MAG TPA: hypothetical protein VJG49_01375, partial [Candidatus Nanoarchaeia archaeon]|nr:hypothetical protein [Candidatus Nanoarchaeia archaeon]
ITPTSARISFSIDQTSVETTTDGITGSAIATSTDLNSILVELDVGETIYVDVDNDGSKDLRLFLRGISEGIADLVITGGSNKKTFENSISYLEEIAIPSDFKPGDYQLVVKAWVDGEPSASSAFTVIGEEEAALKADRFNMYILVIITLAGFVYLLYFRWKKKEAAAEVEKKRKEKEIKVELTAKLSSEGILARIKKFFGLRNMLVILLVLLILLSLLMNVSVKELLLKALSSFKFIDFGPFLTFLKGINIIAILLFAILVVLSFILYELRNRIYKSRWIISEKERRGGSNKKKQIVVKRVAKKKNARKKLPKEKPTFKLSSLYR